AFAIPVGENLRAGTAVVRSRTAHDGSRGSVTYSGYARAQSGELYEVAAIERELVDQLFIDDCAQGGRLRLEQRRLSRHFHRLGDLAKLKRNIDLRLLIDL